MVKAIRNVSLAISGNGRKEPSASESKNIEIARKSLHLKKEVSEGEVIGPDSLIALRPANGISPMEWDKLIGRKVRCQLPAYHQLLWSDLI
jgi:N-acetylneuraminate synthase/N,N'-diacetyllegionaminate synthase